MVIGTSSFKEDDKDDAKPVKPVTPVKSKAKKSPAKKESPVKEKVDAVKAISTVPSPVVMKQLRGDSYKTASGVKFTREDPFQAVEAGEAALLVKQIPQRFVEATREEVAEFYGVEVG